MFQPWLQRLTFLLVLILSFVLATQPSFAQDRIGVGVGTGKITLDEKLKPGTRYELPSLTVINTGTIPAEYEVTVSYHEQQPEIRPDLKWFAFEPTRFSLNPGEAKEVKIVLTLPVKTQPGDYFAYLEAHPAKKADGEGGTSISIAAAAKLYFSVEPANLFQGIYYRVLSLYHTYHIVIKVAVGAVILFLIVQVVRRFVSLDINIKPRTKSTKDTSEKSEQSD